MRVQSREARVSEAVQRLTDARTIALLGVGCGIFSFWLALPPWTLRDLAGPGVAVEVDGGVARDTAAGVYRAGANILVAGSAVFDAASPADAYTELMDVVAGAGAVAWR